MNKTKPYTGAKAVLTIDGEEVRFCDLWDTDKGEVMAAKKFMYACSDCVVVDHNGNYVTAEFVGTKKEARNLGWTETEFGERCPKCSAVQAAQDKIDEETGTISGAGLEDGGLISGILKMTLERPSNAELCALRDLVYCVAGLRRVLTPTDGPVETKEFELARDELEHQAKDRFELVTTKENVKLAVNCMQKIYRSLGVEL